MLLDFPCAASSRMSTCWITRGSIVGMGRKSRLQQREQRSSRIVDRRAVDRFRWEGVAFVPLG